MAFLNFNPLFAEVDELIVVDTAFDGDKDKGANVEVEFSRIQLCVITRHDRSLLEFLHMIAHRRDRKLDLFGKFRQRCSRLLLQEKTKLSVDFFHDCLRLLGEFGREPKCFKTGDHNLNVAPQESNTWSECHG